MYAKLQTLKPNSNDELKISIIHSTVNPCLLEHPLSASFCANINSTEFQNAVDFMFHGTFDITSLVL